MRCEIRDRENLWRRMWRHRDLSQTYRGTGRVICVGCGLIELMWEMKNGKAYDFRRRSENELNFGGKRRRRRRRGGIQQFTAEGISLRKGRNFRPNIFPSQILSFKTLAGIATFLWLNSKFASPSEIRKKLQFFCHSMKKIDKLYTGVCGNQCFGGKWRKED